MTRFHSMLSWLALCLLALGGCATTTPQPAEPPLPPMLPGTIARLVVDGPNAFIDGNPVPSGSYVRSGEEVSTGEGTSAKLLLNDGGEIQLDENTDPLFREGACLFMRIVYGKVAFRNMRCLEFEDGLRLAGVARSEVHILSLKDQSSRVTVLGGEVDIRSPRAATLRKLDEYVATAEGVVQVLRLTPQEAASRVDWTRKYFNPRAAPPRSGGLSQTEASVIGGIFGAAVDALLNRNRDRRRRDRTEPSEPVGTVPESRTQTDPRRLPPNPTAVGSSQSQ